MKQFVALARVSSREQEREGFSLDVQVAALERYAASAGGKLLKLWRISETASKTDERKTFKELIAFCKKHSGAIDGLLFYKVDRAARNLVDYVELEKLESEHGVPFISVSQPTDSNPAGRMMRRTLANMASFYTEQQSVDVREGHARRVQEGWFLGKAPYGYRNVRRDGRGLVEVDPAPAANVRRMFHLFAYESLTLDGVAQKLASEGLVFRAALPAFPRSSIHNILQDRAYIGELEYQGQWYPGKHEPLIDRATWDRVQALLSGKTYKAHELTYAGGLVRCAHCGNLITGEEVTKKSTGKVYRYYRCTMYNLNDHPRTRVTERQLDEQVQATFASIEQPQDVKDWFARALRDWSRTEHVEAREQTKTLQREMTTLREQRNRLLNLRLLDEINPDTFAAKDTELRDRIATLTLALESADRNSSEQADLAIKVFELSQALSTAWLTADFAAKRRMLEMVFLNFKLDGVTLCYDVRKPFDVLVKGLRVPSDRGDRI